MGLSIVALFEILEILADFLYIICMRFLKTGLNYIPLHKYCSHIMYFSSLFFGLIIRFVVFDK